MQINVEVRNRMAATTGRPYIVCGNSDYVIAFSFDSEWDAYNEKTAVFAFVKCGVRSTIEVPFSGAACYAPVLSGIDRVEIGVYAGQIRTTTPAIVPCRLSISDYTSEETTPKTDVFNDIMEQIALSPMPELADDEYFVMTLEGDYVTTIEGDYVIAKE